MNDIKEYILEKLHISKNMKDDDIRVLFMRVMRKGNGCHKVIPDIVEVLSEDNKSIKFEYLTNNYNQQGKIKTLKKDTDLQHKDYRGTYIYTVEKKYVFIKDKNECIEIFNRIKEENKQNINVKIVAFSSLLFKDKSNWKEWLMRDQLSKCIGNSSTKMPDFKYLHSFKNDAEIDEFIDEINKKF